MKVLILSDTHIGQRITRLPDAVVELLPVVDAIIHAGDFTDWDTVQTLTMYPNFYGVAGNMDDGVVKKELPEHRLFQLGGLKIALAHGWGAPISLPTRIVHRYFEKNSFDILIYGHSHIPEQHKSGSILVLNPGSVAGNTLSSKGSYAILEIQNKQASAEIVSL